MQYVISLNNVKKSDLGSVGVRAMDLAELREKGLNIPLSFVLNNQAFEEFLSENNLQEKIFHSLNSSSSPRKAYDEILAFFAESRFPDAISTEISEAYESLTIEPGSTASAIISKWDMPFVNLIRSPYYPLGTEDVEGILQNIRGLETLLGAIKLSWASFYSPESISFRKEKGIGDNFRAGLIIQKMKKAKQAAVAYSYADHDDKLIVVKGFIGMQDFGFDREILGKDYHEVNPNSLSITKSEINVQECAIERGLEKEELILQDLKGEGSRQKVDDRQVSEIARITKRAKSFLGKDIKVYFEMKDDYKYVLLACQRAGSAKRAVIEHEEAVVQVQDVKAGDSKAIVVEHKHEVEVAEGENELGLPKILSPEEAKKEVLAEDEYLARELCPEPEDDIVRVDESTMAEPEAQVYDAKADEPVEEEKIEEKVEQEVNLLEEVLKIKEITERMEEHALNNSHESYNQEARKLKEMMRRLREQ